MKRISLIGLLTIGILATAVWSFTTGPDSVFQKAPSVAAGERVNKITLLEPLVSDRYALY